MPSRSLESAVAAHIAEIIKATRALLAADGVIEDALSAVLRGAIEEFQCRIVVSSPARLLIDGHSYEWPAIDGKMKAGGNAR
jgi:hypothetical protein